MKYEPNDEIALNWMMMDFKMHDDIVMISLSCGQD